MSIATKAQLLRANESIKASVDRIGHIKPSCCNVCHVHTLKLLTDVLLPATLESPARMLTDQLGFSVRTPAWQHVLFTPTYLYRSQVDNRKLYFGLGLASTIACLLLVVDPSVKKHPVYLNMLKTMTMTGVRSKEWPLISSGDQLFFFCSRLILFSLSPLSFKAILSNC